MKSRIQIERTFPVASCGFCKAEGRERKANFLLTLEAPAGPIHGNKERCPICRVHAVAIEGRHWKGTALLR